MKKLQQILPFLFSLLFSIVFASARSITIFICNISLFRNLGQCDRFQITKASGGSRFVLTNWDYGWGYFSLFQTASFILFVATVVTLLIYIFRLVRHKSIRSRDLYLLIIGLFFLIFVSALVVTFIYSALL